MQEKNDKKFTLKMKKINIIITGCMGRMGQQLIKSAKLNNSFKIVHLTENRIVKKKNCRKKAWF